MLHGGLSENGSPRSTSFRMTSPIYEGKAQLKATEPAGASGTAPPKDNHGYSRYDQ